MKNEIIAGLRNAIERGASLEDAIQTFINAGYNPNEVRNSAQVFTSGMTDIIEEHSMPSELPKTKKSDTKNIPLIRGSNAYSRAPRRHMEGYKPKPLNVNPKHTLPKMPSPKKKGSRKLSISIIILILLVVVLGIIFLVYRYFL